MTDLMTLFDSFFTGLLFLINNTVLMYLVGLCVLTGVFALIKSLIK